MLQTYGSFELSEPDERPLKSRTDVIVRGLQYRRIGAFRNALDLYRRFDITEEFAGLAEDAWTGHDLRTCLDALRATRDVRRLLYRAGVLKPYGMVEWVEAFQRAAADIQGPAQPTEPRMPTHEG